MSEGSYVAEKFSEDILDEIRRLGVQVDLFWTEEREAYADVHLPENARILDIGSGPGFYVRKLASLFPTASFVSLEYDATFADYQREVFSQPDQPDVEVICGDVMTAEGIGEFDLVVSRMVLEHLPDPDDVFDKMNSFVKDKGWLFLVDNDFSNHLRTYPRVDELDDLYSAYCKLRLLEGGNPYIGRELPRFFARRGHDNIEFRAICAHTNTIDKSLFLGAESAGIGRALIKQGCLNESVFNKLIVNWSKMARDPDNVMTREIYCASGIKNTANSIAAKSRANQQTIARLTIAKPTKRSAGESFTPPTTELEKQLSAIWCEILEIPEVSTADSFFDIGGESYAVPLVVDALQERHGIKIEITDVFEYPSIQRMAKFIEGGASDGGLEKASESALRQKSAVSGTGDNPFARLIKKK